MKNMPETKAQISLSSPHMGVNELDYLNEVFSTNGISPTGPSLELFEKTLAGFCDTSHSIALSSGTSAIHLALVMLGVGEGDFVLCQSFTSSATVNPIKYLGATPVFIDSEPGTWNMDPVLLEKAIVEITTRCGKEDLTFPGPLSNCAFGFSQQRSPKIKAIIPVHLYGMPAKMDEILSVAMKYDIRVIEDAAEAFGSRYYCKPAGSMGHMGVLSFNGNKIITTSGGGALLSDDQDLIEKARFLATQSTDNAPHCHHSEVGFNYRMSNVLAGIGLGQMEVLPERIERRREINRFYRDSLYDIPGLAFQTEPSAGFFSNYWLTAITVDPSLTGKVTHEDLRLAMARENIEARPLWKPLHLQPVFEGAPAYLNGVSEKLFSEGLCLPSGSNLTEGELNRVVKTLLRSLSSSGTKSNVSKQKAA